MASTSLTLLISACVLTFPALAADAPKVVNAVRADFPPVIDGWVNDVQWQKAPPILDFRQFDPEEGVLPTEITSVRLLYDDRALYVGVICYDAHPEKIVRQLTRRDRTSEADRFSVMIDSYYDRQTAFVFATNVSGVQSDGVLSQDGSVYDITWDAVWNVRTRVFQDGWSAEFAIPYNALRFAEQPNGVYRWGINFRRYISRKKETDEWVMVPRSETLQISKWGHVDGIRGIAPPLHLEVLPYASGTAQYETATDAHPWSKSYRGQAGVDLKWGMARNFTLDATVNPDFGQVEVDESVLNLTVFETRFPEKRPFFVEGAQMFIFGSSVDNTPLSLFFSRRIGKQPTGSPYVTAPPGGTVDDNPQVTTILGAAKVSGRTNGGFSLGAMTANTGEMDAVLDSAGIKTRIRTEPRGSYNLVRAKQEFDGGSWLGGMGTLALRDGILPSFSGGLDWNVHFGGSAYTLDGYVAGARSSADRVLNDGSSGNDGAAGRLLFSRIAAEHWFYTGSFDFYTRYFNCNDIGFFAQPHDFGDYVQLIYRENFGTGIFRRYAFSLVPATRWNWNHILTTSTAELTFTGEFLNFWRPTVVYDMYLPAYDDEERGIIGIYRRPAGHSFTAQVQTDPRANVFATLTGIYAFNKHGKKAWTGSLGLSVRPVSWVELDPTVLWLRSRKDEAWVYPYGNVPDTRVSSSLFSVFGDRDVDEMDLELRGTVTFTKNLSLQFFTQILLARGGYRSYRRFDGGTPIPYPSDPPLVNADSTNLRRLQSADFNEAILNANVLLRWEYIPGSTLYLVWTQGRFGNSGDYGTGFGPRFRDTFILPHEDVLVLKVSYWFPL
jgi:hypothetical protein